jgi:hypothetical protein
MRGVSLSQKASKDANAAEGDANCREGWRVEDVVVVVAVAELEMVMVVVVVLVVVVVKVVMMVMVVLVSWVATDLLGAEAIELDEGLEEGSAALCVAGLSTETREAQEHRQHRLLQVGVRPNV